jgi:hypothetical protein
MNYPLPGKMRPMRRGFNVCTATRRGAGVNVMEENRDVTLCGCLGFSLATAREYGDGGREFFHAEWPLAAIDCQRPKRPPGARKIVDNG